MATKTTLSKEEQDIYDRQIRIWGHDFQQKLAHVSTLVIGCGILGQEFCKNILLGGIRHVTLMDDKIVDENETNIQPLIFAHEDANLRYSEALKKNSQILNPFATIEVIDESSFDNSEQQHKASLSKYDVVVCCTSKNLSLCGNIEKSCSQLDIPFLLAMGFENYGFMFNGMKNKMIFPKDSHDRNFFVKFLSKKYPYSCLNMLAMFHPKVEKFENDFMSIFPPEIVTNIINNSRGISAISGTSGPVGSVVGAISAQELFKILGNGLEPIDNYFHYDMIENVGVVIRM